jgi:hypothetical protein
MPVSSVSSSYLGRRSNAGQLPVSSSYLGRRSNAGQLPVKCRSVRLVRPQPFFLFFFSSTAVFFFTSVKTRQFILHINSVPPTERT